jgi:hypothetical protein
MAKKRAQNRIAESRWALPVTAVYAILVCVIGKPTAGLMWMQIACLTVSTYLMVVLNNANALIRIYSRMVSCSFMVLTLMEAFLSPSIKGAIVQLCFIAFYLTLFNAYQDKRASGWVFYAFFSLGLASMLFIQILYFVPILWVLIVFNVLAMSGRTFWASLLGLIVPYWFLCGYFVYIGDFDTITNYFLQLTDFSNLLNVKMLSQYQIVTFIFVTILSLTGMVHFLRNSYKDKIRVRMLFEIFMTIDITSLLLIILMPQFYDILIRIAIINAAVLIGHFLSLTHTKITNIAFFVILIASLVITAYNVWQPSLTF